MLIQAWAFFNAVNRAPTLLDHLERLLGTSQHQNGKSVLGLDVAAELEAKMQEFLDLWIG